MSLFELVADAKEIESKITARKCLTDVSFESKKIKGFNCTWAKGFDLDGLFTKALVDAGSTITKSKRGVLIDFTMTPKGWKARQFVELSKEDFEKLTE